MSSWEMLLGNCFDVLPKLSQYGRRFDALIADPPYCSGGMTPQSTTSSRGILKYVEREDLGTFTDSMSQRAYTLYTSEWLRLSRTVLKDSAYFFIFTDWRQYPVVSDAVMIAGFAWRGTAIWDKKNSRPNKGRISQNAEFIIWGTAGSETSEKIQAKGVFSYSPPCNQKRLHPTEKAVEVFEELYKVLPDDAESVLDPFAGSAPAGVAALKLGLNYTGVELEECYYKTASERLLNYQLERSQAGSSE